MNKSVTAYKEPVNALFLKRLEFVTLKNPMKMYFPWVFSIYSVLIITVNI
jgi:hypothetical protein